MGWGRELPGSGDAQASRQHAKWRPEDDKPQEDTNRWGGIEAGKEEEWRRRTGGQGLETRPPSGLAGTGPHIEAGRGEECFEDWQRKDRT